MKELLDLIASCKSEMRSMLDTAETEKRSLTDAETAKFNEYKSRKEIAERKLQCIEDPNGSRELDVRSIFAENASKAVANGHKTVLDVRADPVLTDSTAVADTIPILYKDIVEATHEALILDQLGVPMQTNVQGEPQWPTLAGVEATIEGENAEVADKKLEFGKIKASPKRIAISIPVSRRAFNQSNLDLYGIVTKQIGLAVAKVLNKWFFNTTGKLVAGTTTGAFVKDAPDVAFTADVPTLEEIVDLETAVLDQNIDGTGVGAYFVSPAMAGKLKTTPVEAGNPKMVLENGEMNGYPVKVTNLVPAGHVLFGFVEYAVISQFGSLELIIDPYTGARSNKVNFVLNGDYDQTILRPEAFAVGKKVVAG